MLITKSHRPIPNQKLINNPPSEITHSYMDPAEMIQKYGPPKRPLKKRYRA